MKKSISVYGQKVNIKMSDTLVKERGWNGCYDYDKKEITLDTSLKNSLFMQVLIHEVIHATFHRAGLLQTKMDQGIEEIICEQISTVLIENFEIRLKPR